MYNHLLYVSFWATNTLILIFAGIFANDYLALGNSRFNNIESGVYAGFWITFIIWVFWDFSISRRYNLEKKYRSFIFFFMVNLFAFWAVSMFERFIGFKMMDYYWFLILAFIATFFQRAIKRIIVKKSLYSAWF